MISIIVPTYNRANKVLTLVQSIIKDLPADWELIIVDDGSNDDTFSLLTSTDFGKNCKIYKTKNSGPSSARNFGASKASKKYLKFHDSDDLICMEGIKGLLSASEAGNFNTIYVGDVQERKLNNTITDDCYHGFQNKSSVGIIPDEIFFQYDISTCIPLWPKETFIKLGGFNSAIDNGEDTILAVKAYLSGYRFYRLPLIVTIVCEHEGDRLSVINSSSIFFNKQVKKFLLLSDMARASDNKKAKRLIALRVWCFARVSVHNNHIAISELLFRSANEVCPYNDLNLKILYKVIVFFLGAVSAEKFFIFLKGRTLFMDYLASN